MNKVYRQLLEDPTCDREESAGRNSARKSRGAQLVQNVTGARLFFVTRGCQDLRRRWFSRQNLGLLVLALALLTGGASLAQNKYDVLARTLQPYGALFYSKSPTKALQTELILRSGPSAADGLLNKPFRVTLQIPDKLRIESLDPDNPTIVCRVGQRVWVCPRELADKIAPRDGTHRGPPAQIPNFRLPLKDNQLAFLPVFFQILRFEEASGPESKPAWKLEFRPSPELLGRASEDWSAVALIDQSDYALRQLEIQWKEWNGSFDIVSSKFTAELPRETWEPGAALADRSFVIPPELFSSALQQISSITFSR
jgi:hypothetical protein